MNTLSSMILIVALALRAEPELEGPDPSEPTEPTAAPVELTSPEATADRPLELEAAPLVPDDPSPAASEPAPVRVEVELVSIPEAEAPYLERAVLSELDRLLAVRGFVATAEAERSILVRIELVNADLADYRIDIALWSHGQRLEPTLGQIACTVCPDIMVIETIAEHMPAALDALGRAPTVASIESDPIGSPGPAREPASMDEPELVPRSPTSTPRREVRQLGPVGILGTTLGLGGLGVMAYGCFEVAKGRRREIDASNDERFVFHDHERGGWTLYGVGLGITAVGIVAITVDVSALYERRARRVAVTPVLDSTHVGLRLRGRF